MGREGLRLEGKGSPVHWGGDGGGTVQKVVGARPTCGGLRQPHPDTPKLARGHPKRTNWYPTCFHASFFPFCPLCWPPLFLPFSRHIFAIFSPSKSALFCRAKDTAQSLEKGSSRMDLARKFGKEIPSRNLREKRSGMKRTEMDRIGHFASSMGWGVGGVVGMGGLSGKKKITTLRAQRLKKIKISLRVDGPFQARLKISSEPPTKAHFACGNSYRHPFSYRKDIPGKTQNRSLFRFLCPYSGIWYRRSFLCTLISVLGVQGTSAKTALWKHPCANPRNERDLGARAGSLKNSQIS